MKYYLYLITTNNTFKVGITSSPKHRNKHYKLHNTSYTFEGIFEVDNKEIEKSIHMALLRKGYKLCQGYKEWFEGNFSLAELEQEINDYKSRINFCKLEKKT